jgi:3'-phosphoadenosine 5'-phosphosulfate sulfotransferase (PAPS reductase)/FAD synthetase
MTALTVIDPNVKAPKPNTTTLLPLDQYDYVLVSYSGGKDSLDCILQLFKRGVPKEKIELWHQDIDGQTHENTLMDWPVTREYVKITGQALGLPVRFQWRDGGFEKEMLRNNQPTGDVYFEDANGKVVHLPTKRANNSTRMKFPQVSADLRVRWCSAYLKIDVFARALNNDPRFAGKKILVVTGERRQESTARSRYAEFEKHRCSRKGRRVDQWRIIIDHSEQDVWNDIAEFRINPHPAYYLGWGRVSCLACIFGDKDQWASVRTLAPNVFDRISKQEVEFNCTIKKGESVVVQADKGREFVSDKPERVRQQALGQISYTIADFWTPEGQEWVQPAGAYKRCGGPT